MCVVFVVFVDRFCKPLILLTFIDFELVVLVWFLRVVLWSCGSCVVFCFARSALRTRNGKSPLNATHKGIEPVLMRVLCA